MDFVLCANSKGATLRTNRRRCRQPRDASTADPVVPVFLNRRSMLAPACQGKTAPAARYQADVKRDVAGMPGSTVRQAIGMVFSLDKMGAFFYLFASWVTRPCVFGWSGNAFK